MHLLRSSKAPETPEALEDRVPAHYTPEWWRKQQAQRLCPHPALDRDADNALRCTACQVILGVGDAIPAWAAAQERTTGMWPRASVAQARAVAFRFVGRPA